jgi:D-lyxose ketol-isomerase
LPLKDILPFQLKPYVDYSVDDITQSEFTAQDLFDECYAKDIIKDYQSGKIDVKTVEAKKAEYLKKPS